MRGTAFSDQVERLVESWGMALGLFLVYGILTPFVEEIFFRGILQDSLTRKYDPPIAIMVGAVTFAAFHTAAQNDVGLTLAILALGLFAGWVRKASGSLHPPVVLHGVYNTMNIILLFGG